MRSSITSILQLILLTFIIQALFSAHTLAQQDLEILRQKADAGDAASAAKMGFLLLEGGLEPIDDFGAFHYLSKAAEGGNVGAMAALAHALNTGDGIAQDKTRALGLFEKAAEGGNVGAMAALAHALNTGDGIAQDKARAHGLFKKAAEGGNVGAMVALARALSTGDGIEQDMVRANALVEKAAERGHVASVIAVLESNPNSFVELLQTSLRNEGYPVGTVNGMLDKSTISALMNYCKDKSIAKECAKGPLDPDVAKIYSSFIFGRRGS